MEDAGRYPADRTPWTQRLLGRSAEPRRHHVTFADLVRAHHAWLAAPDTEEQRYRDAVAAFEEQEGRIDDVYWCSDVASAAAVTVQPFHRSLGVRPRYRFHRATAWASQPDEGVATLLNRCDELGVRISQTLRGTGARITMGLVMSAAKDLLPLVEPSTRFDDARATRRAIETETANLRRIADEYRRTAMRQMQLIYVSGTLLGFAVLAAVVLLVLWAVHVLGDVSWVPTDSSTSGKNAQSAPGVSMRMVYVTLVGGAIGALVSVIARVNSNSFAVDYEAGRGVTLGLGTLRPAIGAVFGLALYGAVVSDLLQVWKVPQNETKQFWFFLVIAFLAGFTERWAKDVLVEVEGKTSKPPPASAADCGPPA